MARQGYLIVPSSHPLFAASRLDQIQKRVQSILHSIEISRNLKIAPFTFRLMSQSKAERHPAVYMRALFTIESNESVRLLFTTDEIEQRLIEKYFNDCPLIVTIRQTDKDFTSITAGLLGSVSGHIEVSASHADRAIEDFFVDIALGNFFRQFSPLSNIVDVEGLAGVFRRKVLFVRSRLQNSWISEVKSRSTYAIISSLNRCSSTDIDLRGKSAFDAWREFSKNLSYEGSTQPLLTEIAHLQRIPIVGGQLPIRRIRNALSRLPKGRYILIVLRRSMRSSKSPKFRAAIRNLFNNLSRVNSFIIVKSESFAAQGLFVRQAIESGHLFVRQIDTASDVVIGGDR